MIGRIVGKSIGEIIFRQSYNQDTKIGEILIADDKEKNSLFFLRVIDIQYGQEGDEKWSLRTAGDMLLLDEKTEEYMLKEKERRLFKICVCKPLGYVKNGKFHKPKKLPSHFCLVRKANKEDYKFIEKYMGDIEIGKIRSGEDEIDVKVGIRGDLIPYHIGIFATTGMGKSNLMRVFTASAMKSGKYGILIIDPHGEYYEALKKHPLASKRAVFYSEGARGVENRLVLATHEISISDFEEIFELSEAQREALYALYSKFRKKWLDELYEKEIEELVEIFNRRIQDITFSVLKRRAERIVESDIVTQNEDICNTDAIIKELHNGKVILIDTSSIYEYEELLVSVLIARKILYYNKNIFRDKEKFRKIPPVMITIEEAQRVLQNGIFAQIAREGRKFKVGLCAITQQPKLIKEDLLSQFNTFFILGLADENDRNILKHSAKQDISALEKEIQTLEIGEAIMTYPGAPFAIPAKIHLYEDYIKNMEKEKIPEEKVDEKFY
ncbi:MAG: ATP-binding protein [Thermoplasmatales archaeon]|nr:ATP-binding protein [Thermoplasmatales archaeon]